MNKKTNAAGLLEVYGFVTALAAVDAACKAADVTVDALDKNKPANAEKLPVPLVIMVKLRGAVSEVEAALSAGKAAANEIGGVVSSHLIAMPDFETEKILTINVFN